MRDIEFRGISIAYDSFIYGYYYENNDKSFIVTKKGNHIQVHKNSVGQYTGRKDTNNVKIYENDIVKFNKQATSIWWHTGIIEYKKDQFVYSEIENKFIQYLNCIDSFHIKVKGNTYQHSQLLNEQDEKFKQIKKEIEPYMYTLVMISFHVYLLNEIIKRDKKYYLIFKTSTGEKIEFLHPIPFISLKENLNDKKYNELLKYFVS